MACLTMISKTATRPGLSIRGISSCEMTACIHRGKLDADLFLLVGGKGVHNTVDCLRGAGGVQGPENKVPRFRRRDGGINCSRSRISPTRIMSGSWRKTRRNASAKLGTSTPISRWVTIAFLCL